MDQALAAPLSHCPATRSSGSHVHSSLPVWASKSAYHTVRHIRPGVIVDRRAHHYDAVQHDGWRGHVVPAIAIGRDTSKIDLAIHTEIGTWCACHCIQRQESCIQGCLEQPQLATRCARIAPCCQPAIDQAIAVRRLFVDLGVISPQLIATGRIERDDTVERCG